MLAGIRFGPRPSRDEYLDSRSWADARHRQAREIQGQLEAIASRSGWRRSR